MATISPKYMTVSVDLQVGGINLSGWFSTVEFWMSERMSYPYDYEVIGDDCVWKLHSNAELTLKAQAAVTEYADKICKEAEAKNSRRKIVNRS